MNRRFYEMTKHVLLMMAMVSVLLLAGCASRDGATEVPIGIETPKKISLYSVENDMIAIVHFSYYDEDNQRTEYVINFDDNQIKKNGEVFDVDGAEMEALAGFINDYNKPLFAGQYWPDTDEYPEMKILFDYSMIVYQDAQLRETTQTFSVDGCEDYGYPKDWDLLIDRVEQAMK